MEHEARRLTGDLDCFCVTDIPRLAPTLLSAVFLRQLRKPQFSNSRRIYRHLDIISYNSVKGSPGPSLYHSQQYIFQKQHKLISQPSRLIYLHFNTIATLQQPRQPRRIHHEDFTARPSIHEINPAAPVPLENGRGLPYQVTSRSSGDVLSMDRPKHQDLLKLFGLPYITAPKEAEALCAELVPLALLYGIV